MAEAQGGSHGGKRENSGRKRKHDERNRSQKNWNSQQKRIYLSQTIFESWKNAKTVAGYGSCSDSNFAAHLLSLECRRRADITQHERNLQTTVFSNQPGPGSSNVNMKTTMEGEGPQFTSTPLKRTEHVPSINIDNSPIVETHDNETEVDTSVISPVSTSFERLNISLFTDDEEDTSEESSSEENISLHDVSCSAMKELNAEKDGETQDDSDEESEQDISLDIFGGDEIAPDSEDEIDDIFMDISDVEEHEKSENVLDSHTNTVKYGPHKKHSRGEEKYNLKQEISMVDEKKFICSLDLLIGVFEARCQESGCTSATTVKHHFIGTTLVLTCSCLSGHEFRFCSSHDVNGIYASNLQTAASILFSGNSFAKIERLANFCRLAFLSSSSYYRLQRLYLIPAIDEWWLWMRGEILDEFTGKSIIVGGDGQCDSPGFNAKNMCYFINEVETKYIIDIEILDKRHVGLISTNMEREGVRRGLNALSKCVKVVELVTDASTSIKTLIAAEFKDVVHSLDVWHKSKSIKKCLAKLSKPKAMSKIKDWSAHIVRHFWHCSSVCRKDETTSLEEALKIMKDKWIALLHHVCNEHDWIGGQCDHVEEEHDKSLPWFDRRDKDFLELQKVILNPVLLASFSYYTRFRHTGSIECANSLSLVYTPKRMPFSYRAYKARKQLTAIDWNYHVNLPQAMAKGSGEALVTRKYTPRTRQWDQKIVKVTKGYEYIPVLTAAVLRRRQHDVAGVTEFVPLNESDPGIISPNIAHNPAPPTKEIIQRRSRFAEKK